MSDNKDFFKQQTASSRIKATIISEYFPQYCKIISNKHEPERLGYFDMFAGPGIYDDDSWSTPLLLAKNCNDDPFLRDKVWMVFNDMAHGEKLKENFEKYFPKGTFKFDPYFMNETFGDCPKIDSFLTGNTPHGFYNECPSLLFIDPWGYKHINTQVLTQFLKPWGNELFIFINTKRLNAAFENNLFQEDLKIVFPLTYDEVRTNKKLKDSVEERHKFIINQLSKEFRMILGNSIYYTSFQFREEDQFTPSHYLLHITKGSKGFDLVKRVYSKYSNVETVLDDMDGINTYRFDPKNTNSISMFNEDFKQENIEKLKGELVKTYKGVSISTEKLFKEDQSTGRLHSYTHYLIAFRQLYEEGKIDAKFTDDKKHKTSVLISPTCIITFK